jgi:hypothetical protein
VVFGLHRLHLGQARKAHSRERAHIGPRGGTVWRLPIQGDSRLYRWNGGVFELLQTLSGPGGREFRVVRTETQLFRGKKGVTADAALDLGEAPGTSARLWMNLQSALTLTQAERRRSAA